MIPKTSLIFLTYNKPSYIDARLQDVRRNHASRDDFDVVVFDNGSSAREVQLIVTSHSQMSEFPIVQARSEKNLGFGPGFNRAVTHSDAEIIHLISDDVQIRGEIVSRVRGHLATFPTGVICHRVIAFGGGWNDFGHISIEYPDGYYFAMRRETWDELGGFDEQFAPHDYEDVDLGYRIQRHKTIRLVTMGGLPVRHEIAGTIGYTADRREHTIKMRALFAKKWGLPNTPERP